MTFAALNRTAAKLQEKAIAQSVVQKKWRGKPLAWHWRSLFPPDCAQILPIAWKIAPVLAKAAARRNVEIRGDIADFAAEAALLAMRRVQIKNERGIVVERLSVYVWFAVKETVKRRYVERKNFKRLVCFLREKQPRQNGKSDFFTL